MWQKSIWEMMSALELGSGGTVTCPRFIYHQRNKKHNQNTDVAEAGGCAIDTESLVSMNFWCYLQKFMDVLKNEFPVF